MVLKKLLTLCILAAFVFNSCKRDKDDPEPGNQHVIPEFYQTIEENNPQFTVIGNTSHQVLDPQDLDFNPTRSNELWVINKGIEATGGSTVMFGNAGTPQQYTDYRQDGNAWHFMSLPSALSFSHTGDWATSANVLDANHQGGDFTGPTLWSGNLNIYAKDAGPGTNGSHLDMLHASPYSMGIESERENIYWVFDGYNGNIARYNFTSDHGPGQHYHGDGKVHRYTEVKVKRLPDVPSHMVLDKQKTWLYIIDGGNKRVLRMDVHSGNKLRDLSLINEELAEYWEMGDAVWQEFLAPDFGLNKPCGIEIKDNHLFISDYETGEIICIDVITKQEVGRINTGKKGIMGIKIGPDNKLWYVNAISNEVVRIDPK